MPLWLQGTLTISGCFQKWYICFTLGLQKGIIQNILPVYLKRITFLMIFRVGDPSLLDSASWDLGWDSSDVSDYRPKFSPTPLPCRMSFQQKRLAISKTPILIVFRSIRPPVSNLVSTTFQEEIDQVLSFEFSGIDVHDCFQGPLYNQKTFWSLQILVSAISHERQSFIIFGIEVLIGYMPKTVSLCDL